MSSPLPMRKAEPNPTSVLPALIGFFWLVMAMILFSKLATGSRVNPDDVAEARRMLETERQRAKQVEGRTSASTINRLLDLGLWTDGQELFEEAEPENPDLRITQARLLFLNNNFESAETVVDIMLQQDSGDRAGLLLKAQLKIEAWLLEEAAQICARLLNVADRDEDAALLLGRVKILQKSYQEALEWARRVQDWNDENAAAYLLESDVHFWNQQPERAEVPLRKCLERDPLNAEARFNYGYAIWRRVDATQLDDMAAQWQLALEINPLHYLTHWHWGNGHTNLTYADYAHPTDEKVRKRLEAVDALMAKNRMPAAIQLCRQIEKEFPQSILPALTRGSAFYMAYDMDRKTRLDSAQVIFEDILQAKKHYGPAHNGLAAVIKQKRMTYLATFDSLEAVVAGAEVTDSIRFSPAEYCFFLV